jgi:hypothetical protein
VTADDTAGTVTIDFQVDYMLAASVMVLTSADVFTNSDIKVTYPANGQITITDGATLKLTAGQKISIVAQRRSS